MGPKLTVKCPYGEKKGFAVFCKLINKKVSPLKYPCTSDHYQKCPIYRQYAGAKEEKAEVAETRKEAEEAPPRREPVREEAPPPAGGFKKPEEARTCHECIFYSELTKMCLKLKIKVDDPNNPPCKRGA
ncbi:hypothetical protein [Ignicoccus hospitalis]|uniref:Uncharacterized protein n=1 Tax=Ignicoccus hospitalis (strain KIN4/I / DSM 18386 / JCM 14125) TaxID=453591 RepID=A8ACF6_IGNH4|nr:hypothetical protein [Ignicoccus hospitalis]ABU82608.1 hypothetical protein Igni_1432 [Ignicoccus hospitalis KIN4/I]HIH90604.1 hypothetical protein [Desulfurococcaceae archaeon]